MSKDYKFSNLVGQTFTKIDVGDDEIRFYTKDSEYLMFHSQDCCESVYIEDICGEIDWLIGDPILVAEERTNSDIPLTPKYPHESFTWTFYELATIKGSVTIRWYGTSNGYYSESVDFLKIGDE